MAALGLSVLMKACSSSMSRTEMWVPHVYAGVRLGDVVEGISGVQGRSERLQNKR